MITRATDPCDAFTTATVAANFPLSFAADPKRTGSAELDNFFAAPEARAAIAQAGHARAVRDHTYAHRLTVLLDTVAGRAKGYPEPRITWTEQNAR